MSQADCIHGPLERPGLKCGPWKPSFCRYSTACGRASPWTTRPWASSSMPRSAAIPKRVQAWQSVSFCRSTCALRKKSPAVGPPGTSTKPLSASYWPSCASSRDARPRAWRPLRLSPSRGRARATACFVPTTCECPRATCTPSQPAPAPSKTALTPTCR